MKLNIPQYESVSAAIVLTYWPTLYDSIHTDEVITPPHWEASTGHPNIHGGYLQAKGESPYEALAELGLKIEADCFTFLKAQNITIVYPET